MATHGIMFHHFHDAHHPAGQGALSADEFYDMIQWLQGAYTLLPARDYLDRALSGQLRDNDICLTFDDNLLCQRDVALPVLQDLGLTAFWFVYSSILDGTPEPLEIYRHFRTTRFDDIDDFYNAFFNAVNATDPDAIPADFNPSAYLCAFPFYTDNDRTFRYLRDEILGPDRYHAIMRQMMADATIDIPALARDLWMTPDHLRNLQSADHIIGLHSHTHPTRLERLSPKQQAEEYLTNLLTLSRLLGRRPITMSHPCNSYNHHTLNLLREMNILLGFRANRAPGRWSNLEIPREDHANIVQLMRRKAAA